MEIAVDTLGNSYVTGEFGGSITFGPGEFNQTTLVSFGGGGRDIFVAKYTANGMLVWARQAGGTSDFDEGRGIAVDASGNSYVTGLFQGVATFGPGEANQTTLVSTLGFDSEIFVAKYDGNGNLVWARQAGGTNEELGHGIVADGAGKIYVTGRFEGSATFGAGEVRETTLISAGARDIFIATYDSNGNLVGARQDGGTGGETGWGIAVDSSGRSYVTGELFGAAVFGAGEANETLLTSSGGHGLFVAKYGPDSDNDGVSHEADQCLNSDIRNTVIIQSCDSGVVNVVLTEPTGCTITDEVLNFAVDAHSHGQFVSQVDKFLLALQRAGILEPNEKQAIKDCAAQSTLP